MRTFQQVPELRTYLRGVRTAGKSIGFVPTMGALHDGHLSLVRRACNECDTVVVSVYVNPSQFGPGEDFERYPRDLQRDSRMIQEAGASALFTPSSDEMYPVGSQTLVDVPLLAERWEGAVRPGHFRGVATVCAKLFSIVQPDFAYFGRKDYQQLRVIERLVSDLHMPMKVVGCPTIRESDGLARSSRNAYLNQAERAAAATIHRALASAESLYASGERSAQALEEAMRAVLSSEPSMSIDYAAPADPETLEPQQGLIARTVLLVAVRVGSTRLIDNSLLGFAPDNHG